MNFECVYKSCKKKKNKGDELSQKNKLKKKKSEWNKILQNYISEKCFFIKCKLVH